MPRDRDLGSTPRPLPEQEASRLRKPTRAASAAIWEGPQGPKEGSKHFGNRGLQQALYEVQEEEERTWLEAEALPTGTDNHGESSGSYHQLDCSAKREKEARYKSRCGICLGSSLETATRRPVYSTANQ